MAIPKRSSRTIPPPPPTIIQNRVIRSIWLSVPGRGDVETVGPGVRNGSDGIEDGGDGAAAVVVLGSDWGRDKEGSGVERVEDER